MSSNMKVNLSAYDAHTIFGVNTASTACGYQLTASKAALTDYKCIQLALGSFQSYEYFNAEINNRSFSNDPDKRAAIPRYQTLANNAYSLYKKQGIEIHRLSYCISNDDFMAQRFGRPYS